MDKLIKHSKCCSELSGPSGQPADCVGTWEEDLKTVTNQYNKVAAEADQAQSNYTNASSWKSLLTLWLDNLDKANAASLSITTELSVFVERANATCFNTEQTTKAIKVLLCEIKGIFDCFVSYSAQTGLKEQVADLYKKVDCLTSLTTDEKNAALACIKDYIAKIDAVCALQNDLLAKLVEIYKCVNLLWAAVCGTDGLKDNLDKLSKDFPKDLVKPDPTAPPDDPTQVGNQLFPCDPAAAKPKPEIPIAQGAFYTTMDAECTLAAQEVEKLKLLWETKRKERDKLLARKNSLSDAIKAAAAAESGK